MRLTQQIKEKKRRLQNRLELYYEAEEKVLAGQSFTIGSRSMTRADLGKIQDMIKELECQINSIEINGTGKRVVARIIPRDY